MPVIIAKQYVQIVRKLREQRVQWNDSQLSLKFEVARAAVLGGGVSQLAAQSPIDLPDLEAQSQAEIVKDNVLAMSAIYFAAQLEELKFFQVADKMAEQFLAGQVPISRGQGGQVLYNYIREAPERWTEAERRGFYARAFGFAQGAVDEPLPNREFSDLWIRFVSSVSVLNRESNQYFGQRRALTALQMIKNGRDLAVNLSLHGYGVIHFAAFELQGFVREIMQLMAYPEVLAAYGVTDIWQLVERVSGTFLGGSVNSVRQRTLASAGATIIQWLAEHQQVLLSPTALDARTILDDAIVDAVERWLAVTGTGDAALDKYFEPVSVAAQPTIPGLQLAAAPDLLKSMMARVGGNGSLAPQLDVNLPNVTPQVKA